MVFYCRCFSLTEEHEEHEDEEEEEIEDDMITQTKSTTSQTYYTASSHLTSSISETHKSDFSYLPSQSSNPTRIFTLVELKAATNDFCPSSKISENGSGDVFRGVVKSSEDPFDEIQVAVKCTKEPWPGREREWLTEINILGLIKHPDIVKLVGYYIKGDDARFLVYEYMPNRSVHDHLYSSSSETSLSWTTRLKVAQDTARGLAYLHEGTGFAIIFGDIKSSNVLLDEQWNAKFSDFGLTRLRLQGLSHAPPNAITTGYEAIEYMETGCLSAKTDVWSFGVFLCELITGKHPLDTKQPQSVHLLEWVTPFLESKDVHRFIIDPRLESSYSLQSAQKLSVIAGMCLLEDPKSRPKMSEVLEMVNQLIECPSQAANPEPSLGDVIPSQTTNSEPSFSNVVPSQATDPEPSIKSLVRRVANKLKKVFTCSTKV